MCAAGRPKTTTLTKSDLVEGDQGGQRMSDRFETILAEDNHNKPVAFYHSMDEMFRGVNLSGATILDVGSGRGLTSIFMALRSAKRIVSMEPELDGSNLGVIQLQESRLNNLELENVEILTDDFNETKISEKFDVLVSNASINHIKESENHALQDLKTYDSFCEIANRFSGLLKPGGVAVVTDACRYAFFPFARRMGLPKRFCLYGKNINYKIHQNPNVWRRIFLDSGFKKVEIDYPVPFRLRSYQRFLNNSISNFFLRGCFILRAWV